VLIKESMNVMENNSKSKTVSASKVDNVSRNLDLGKGFCGGMNRGKGG
jgi:hypothetical protein